MKCRVRVAIKLLVFPWPLPVSGLWRKLNSLESSSFAGSNEEMLEFRQRALRNARLAVHVELPRVTLDLHGADVLTALYHRLACDLALWSPSAPSLSSAGPSAGHASLAHAWESMAPQFLNSIHCVPMGDMRCRGMR